MTRRSDPTKALIRSLKTEFKRHYRSEDSLASWAWPFVPSIPFVGDKYHAGEGLMIFASAENFTWMDPSDIPPRFSGSNAWDRYRAAYEQSGRSADSFFPDVGIQPLTDGGLPCAGLFVADRLHLPTRKSPRDFIETLAFTNWAKYTIKADTNRDYLNDRPKLGFSLPFVIAELLILQPAVALLPQMVWRHNVFRAAMQGASPKTRFCPVPQFNATVVNCHLGEHARSAKTLQRCMSDTTLGEWMQHLVGLNERNAWRYIALLNELLRDWQPTDLPDHRRAI